MGGHRCRAAVAPSLFSVLRGADLPNANALAGSIVTRLLGIVNRGGFEISIFLLVFGYFMGRGQTKLSRAIEMISLAIMAIMTGVGHWVIAARMTALRAAMQLPIDQIALNDPRRMAFASLHRYSVAEQNYAAWRTAQRRRMTAAWMEGSIVESGRVAHRSCLGKYQSV